MRKLKLSAVLIFFIIQSIAAGMSLLLLLFFEFKFSFFAVFKFIFIHQVLNLIFYRIFLKFFNFPEGEIPKDSKEEFYWMIYTCFWLFIFHPIKNLNLVPVYMSPLTNWLMGGHMKFNSYSNGLIFDPQLVEIGSSSFIGARAMLIPHIQDSKKLIYKKIKIGNFVTIGAQSLVFPGAIIENHAVVGALSLVKPNTHIKSGEYWAGNPAVKIK